MKRLGSFRHLKPATFTLSSSQHWETRNMRYPHHIGGKTVGNTFKLRRPILLTGPNASGKTTLLKSAFLNTLLSQQFGCGFYDKLIMKPYDGFHCYLDIPDTSGRDSLFQAEARRCLDVIDAVADDTKRFFCIFDELYSGTNPTEAVAGAFAFTKFLAKKRNVTFMVTTHFYEFCRLCDANRLGVRNCQMGWTSPDKAATSDSATFTYKVKPGVSSLRGGVRVLKQIGYPGVIVDDATTVLKDYV
jgi:DNA mismatch repair ATPase MutS